MNTINLKNKLGTRFLHGHPWIFSNELVSVPKFTPGSWVELLSEGGEFLAMGYYNPHSLISFRELSRNSKDRDITVDELLLRRIEEALERRKVLGFATTEGSSFRLAFGEADRLPGLVIDAFVDGESQNYVLVFQPATAGADLLVQNLTAQFTALQKLFTRVTSLTLAAAVIKKNSQSRKREGLETAAPEIIGDGFSGEQLEAFQLQLKTHDGSNFSMQADLKHGQKTGFFLDQRDNIHLLTRSLATFTKSLDTSKPVRSLDICSYVGQWSAQIFLELKKLGLSSDLHLFDSSEPALNTAATSLKKLGAMPAPHKGDAMEDLKTVGDARFDVVVCDPPALIKSRSAVDAGKRAYVKLNLEAIKLVRSGGLFVSCSCSSLLDEAEFQYALDTAAGKARRRVLWIGRGSQASDHPVAGNFSEGRYLKCLIGLVES